MSRRPRRRFLSDVPISLSGLLKSQLKRVLVGNYRYTQTTDMERHVHAKHFAQRFGWRVGLGLFKFSSISFVRTRILATCARVSSSVEFFIIICGKPALSKNMHASCIRGDPISHRFVLTKSPVYIILRPYS